MYTPIDSRSGPGAAAAARDTTTAPASGADGRGLVEQATNAQGQLDTRQLGQWVADARRENRPLADQAQAAIESQLVAQGRVGDLARFNQDLRQAEAQARPGTFGVPGMLYEGGRQAGAAGAARIAEGQGLTAAGGQVLRDNPILSKRWEFTESAWTGKGGPTESLVKQLKDKGVAFESTVNTPPPGSVTKGQGIPSAVANNTNGARASDAIELRYAQQYPNAKVSREAGDPAFGRRVDVRVDIPAADPRMSERIDVESKAGRTGSSSETRLQIAKDSDALRASRAARQAGTAMEEAGEALSHSGRALQTVGRVARPVAVVMGAVEVGQAFRADGNRVGENTGRAASGLAGGAAGAWAGAAAGAAIGSVVPGVGTVIGGVVGGVIGGLAGDAGGRALFDTVKGWFS